MLVMPSEASVGLLGGVGFVINITNYQLAEVHCLFIFDEQCTVQHLLDKSLHANLPEGPSKL